MNALCDILFNYCCNFIDVNKTNFIDRPKAHAPFRLDSFLDKIIFDNDFFFPFRSFSVLIFTKSNVALTHVSA